MGDHSNIEWTEATWNPIRARLNGAKRFGYHCEKVSPGCKNCYAERMNARMLPAWGTGLDYAVANRDKVEIYLDEQELLKPLKWKRPRMVFPCSMTDMFAEFVTDEMRERIWAVMAVCHRHTFQVLTKRAELLGWVPRQISMAASLLEDHAEEFLGEYGALANWPLPNVWLGVSVEDQQRADERIPHLLRTPAALRWVSYEPALGPVDFFSYMPCSHERGGCEVCRDWGVESGIDWVVAGGESGPGARPMHPDWARSARDQCVAAGVPFFFKQNGEYASVSEVAGAGSHHSFPDGATVRRFGKKRAGRTLDGREWNEMPEMSGPSSSTSTNRSRSTPEKTEAPAR